MAFSFIERILYPFFSILLLNLVKSQIPTGSMLDTIIPFIWFCVAAIGVCDFRCVASVAHLFYMLIGDIYEQRYSKKNNRYYRRRTDTRKAERLSWQRKTRFWVLLRRMWLLFALFSWIWAREKDLLGMTDSRGELCRSFLHTITVPFRATKWKAESRHEIASNLFAPARDFYYTP